MVLAERAAQLGGTTALSFGRVWIPLGLLRGRFLPPPVSATGAAPGNTGDALRIAAGLGARIENTAEAWWMPMVAVPGEILDGEPCYRSLIRERALPRQIVVNAAGRRFAAEALPYNSPVPAGRDAAASARAVLGGPGTGAGSR